MFWAAPHISFPSKDVLSASMFYTILTLCWLLMVLRVVMLLPTVFQTLWGCLLFWKSSHCESHHEGKPDMTVYNSPAEDCCKLALSSLYHTTECSYQDPYEVDAPRVHMLHADTSVHRISTDALCGVTRPGSCWLHYPILDDATPHQQWVY